MKIFQDAPAFVAPLQIALPAKVRPTEDWLYSTGGKPHDPQTDPLAQQVVDLWRPNQASKPEAIRPGWAGLASYRVPYADGDKHLKMAMVQPKEKAAAYKKLCAEAMGEASRAAWAGALELGPKVHFTCPPLGAFVSDFVPGRIPSLDESSGTLLPLHLQALAQIHRQPALGVPEGGHTNWLLEDYMKVQTNLTAASMQRPAALQQALVQMERGLGFFLERQPAFRPSPIHDDYKPDNTLFDGNKVVVLDWNNLRVADPAIDLGHFSCMVDVAANKLSSDVVTPYAALQRKGNATLANEGALLGSTMAYTSLFRLRNLAFYDQWEGSRPKAEYLRHQVIEDANVLGPNVFRGIGLRADIGT